MQKRHAIAILLLLLFVGATPLDAQRRRRRPLVEPIPSWGIDAHVRYSVLLDDAIQLGGGRVGRQIDSALNLGLSGSLLLADVAETRTERGFERITSLVYLGPSIELRDSLRGPARALLRTAIIGGLAHYERQRDGARVDDNAFIAGIEPELGIQVRATRAIQWTMTVGVLCAWRLEDGARILSGPIATMGIRVVR